MTDAAATIALLDVAVPALDDAVRLGVEAGLDAAAILDAKGTPLALAGDIDREQARALVAHATSQARTPELRAQLLAGELLTLSLGEREHGDAREALADRDARVGIAARCVFFVAVMPREPAAISPSAIDELRADIERRIRDARSAASTPPAPGSGGSDGAPSGSGELPVVEIGVTARRLPS